MSSDFTDPLGVFADKLSPEAGARLLSLMRRQDLPQGRIVYDEIPDGVIFVLSGHITSYVLTSNAKVVDTAHSSPGAVLGLTRVLSGQQEDQAITRTRCVVGVIPGEAFRRFLDEFPQAQYAVAQVLSSYLQAAHAVHRLARSR